MNFLTKTYSLTAITRIRTAAMNLDFKLMQLAALLLFIPDLGKAFCEQLRCRGLLGQYRQQDP
jgi:hypothetical protein